VSVVIFADGNCGAGVGGVEPGDGEGALQGVSAGRVRSGGESVELLGADDCDFGDWGVFDFGFSGGDSGGGATSVTRVG